MQPLHSQASTGAQPTRHSLSNQSTGFSQHGGVSHSSQSASNDVSNDISSATDLGVPSTDDHDEGIEIYKSIFGGSMQEPETSHAVCPKETVKSDDQEHQDANEWPVSSTVDKSQDINLQNLPEELLLEIFSHLAPSCFPQIYGVCRRFYSLMTSSRVWRVAFSRHFPGPASLLSDSNTQEYHDAVLRARCFTRLNLVTSWMDEYVWRTKLIRNLAYGRPGPELALTRRKLHKNSAGITYDSEVADHVSHIDGSFSSDTPIFIHGAANKGLATTSDPVNAGPVPHTWSTSLPPLVFQHFEELYSADAPYGLGAGELVGQPNVMDVSQSYGFVYGEGCPRGRTHFTPMDNRDGMWLVIGASEGRKKLGIPDVNRHRPAVTAVWIAKSHAVPKMSNSSCGIFCGFANGFVSAYSATSSFCSGTQFKPGDITANWALSPGVPIISIKADDSYSRERNARRRVWAVALNALGEVFYLKDIPATGTGLRPRGHVVQDQHAWKRGRTVRWELVEKTKRRKKAQSFHNNFIDLDFCPRSYSDFMELNEDMIYAETQWIDNYMSIPPAEWNMAFHDWDMQRTLLVDFGGNDEAGAGESVVVIGCHNMPSSVKRYTRFHEPPLMERSTHRPVPSSFNSMFSSYPPVPSSGDNWHTSTLSTLGEEDEFTASAIDTSIVTSQTIFEDPMLNSQSGDVNCKSIPGQRARFIAVGNSSGTIYIWDARSQVPRSNDVTTTLQPIRVIHTSSPGISCLALTSLYLVHGGQEGLVQAWDPLASQNNEPIRTIHSSSSVRTRRRLRIRYDDVAPDDDEFTPSSICLDPDPKKLRGIVALGSQLRYWSFSNGMDLQPSRARGHTDAKSAKRWAMAKPTYDLSTFIQDEWEELQLESEETNQQHRLLSARFGTDLLGENTTEEDLIAYAMFLNNEAHAKKVSQAQVRDSVPDEASKSRSPGSNEVDSDLAEAFRRSMLENSPGQSPQPAKPVASSSKSPGSDVHESRSAVPPSASNPNPDFVSDSGLASGSDAQQPENSNITHPDTDEEELNYAIQLSIAENASRQEALDRGWDIDMESAAEGEQREEFPPLGASSSQAARRSKGKGREVIWHQS